MSKQILLEKLTDKGYRDAFISDEIDVGLPMQIRAMREEREWKQSYVAEQTHTKQPRFSLMEKPGYGSFTLSTLKKLAALFDVGLIVSFVPFSEMIEFVDALSPKRLSIPSFSAEYSSMARRYSYAKATARVATAQASLNFTPATRVLSVPTYTPPFLNLPGSPESILVSGWHDVPLYLLSKGSNTHYAKP